MVRHCIARVGLKAVCHCVRALYGHGGGKGMGAIAAGASSMFRVTGVRFERGGATQIV